MAEAKGTKPIISPALPPSKYVEGWRVPGVISEDVILSAINYKPHDEDVFIATYPKCGTTWAQTTTILIFQQGQPLESPMEYFKTAPFLEIIGAQPMEAIPRPTAIKTHLPYRLIPKSDKAKYIYVTRNPKDCCVSFYYHLRGTPGHGFYGTFDDFFEMFISGNLDFGEYFDNLLGWYEHRNDPNVLFMRYEEMRKNPEETILKMASFIDDKLYAEPLRNDPEKLRNIVKYSSFDYMKETYNKAVEELFNASPEALMNMGFPEPVRQMFAGIINIMQAEAKEGLTETFVGNFVRKGIVGDWRNHFSEDQNRRMNEKFAEKTKGTEIATWWEEYM